MTLPVAQELGYAHTIEDYLRSVLEKRPQGTEIGWFFRGQREYDWPLQPKIDRPLAQFGAISTLGEGGLIVV